MIRETTAKSSVSTSSARPDTDEPQQRQRRHQHRESEQPRRRRPVPGPQPQPEMQPHAAMDPGNDHDDALKHAQMGSQPPVGQLHHGIVRIDAVKLGDRPRTQDMLHQQERDRQAEQQLHELPRRHPHHPPVIQRPERMGGMRQSGGQDDDPAAGKLPGQDPAPLVHGLKRGQPKRMVQHVRQHIGEQNHPRNRTQLQEAPASGQTGHGNSCWWSRRRETSSRGAETRLDQRWQHLHQSITRQPNTVSPPTSAFPGRS